MRLLTWSGCRHVESGELGQSARAQARTGVTRRTKTVLGRTNSAMWLVLSALVMDFRDAEARKSARQVSVQTPPDAALELPFEFPGPPPPVPPAMVTRDEDGRVTMRAVRLPSPLQIDGVLDESLYTSIPPVSDFIQLEPRAGLAATEKTDVWVAFDAAHVYVSLRCWESQPERVVAHEMRRDSHATYRQ